MSSDAQKIAEIAADGVADGMHVVGEEALAAEKVIRSVDSMRMAFLGLGVAIGAAAGAMAAYTVAYRKAEAKYSKIADEDVKEMREHYRAKVQALDATTRKASLEDIVAERGYVAPEDGEADEDEEASSQGVAPPMAVAPPSEVVEAAADTATEETSRVPPPVPARPASPGPGARRNLFRDADERAAVADSWDLHAELSRRSPDTPYVIHYDEREDFEEYHEMTLTYYEGDDVLCNDQDEVIAKGEERDDLIGEGNLNRFGHGSNDPSIVYIRNDKLEIMMEVIRSPNSYAEEVHGLAHTDYSSNLERMRRREALDDDG